LFGAPNAQPTHWPFFSARSASSLSHLSFVAFGGCGLREQKRDFSLTSGVRDLRFTFLIGTRGAGVLARRAIGVAPIKAKELINGASYGPDALRAIGHAFDAAWAEIAGNFGNDVQDIARKTAARKSDAFHRERRQPGRRGAEASSPRADGARLPQARRRLIQKDGRLAGERGARCTRGERWRSLVAAGREVRRPVYQRADIYWWFRGRDALHFGPVEKLYSWPP
jgi:hypothetical protein